MNRHPIRWIQVWSLNVLGELASTPLVKAHMEHAMTQLETGANNRGLGIRVLSAPSTVKTKHLRQAELCPDRCQPNPVWSA